MNATRWMGLAACAATFALLDCGSSDPGPDSETHWLATCTASTDCLGGTQCLCGRCTMPCDTTASCSGGPTGTTCYLSDTCPGGGTAPIPGICTARCLTNADCPSSLVCLNHACAQSAGVSASALSNDPAPLTSTFLVSDEFAPSNWMGDGVNGTTYLSIDQEGTCKQRAAGARGDCLRFVYKEGPLDWAGVYWVFPTMNWGEKPGRAVEAANFKSVQFKYAVEAPTVTRAPAVVVAAGRVAGMNMNCQSDGRPYLDCTDAGYGVVVFGTVSDVRPLNREWQTGAIDISGWPTDVHRVVGGFSFAVEFPAEARGGTEPYVVYFDDIVWSTDPVGAAP